MRESVTGQRWHVSEPGAEAVRLSAELGLSPLLARILAARGLGDPVTAEAFLNPREGAHMNPTLLGGVKEALARLKQAVAEGGRIRVFGDYDADGVCATALMVRQLRGLGAKVDYHLPRRLIDGYGLSVPAIEAAAADGIALGITVDNGISAQAALERARELGLPMIVTDHHQPPAALPPAVAIVNPHLAGETYPFPDLCGAAVALKLIQAWQGFGPDAPWRQELDVVALATVADVMPLRGENRWLVQQGLQRLRRSPRPGLAALMAAAGLTRERVSARDLGFALGPRLNALGRTGDAHGAVDLLLVQEQESAVAWARHLERANRERQALELEVMAAAEAAVREQVADGRAVVVACGAGWHVGVLGIVAARLARRFYRPVLLAELTQDDNGIWLAKGSGRSIPDFNLIEGLRQADGLLRHYGGHHQAAGFTFAASQAEALQSRLCALAADSFPNWRPTLKVDAACQPDELTKTVVRELERLEPCGTGNPSPRLLLADVLLEGRAVGRAESHLQLRIHSRDVSLGGIAFGLGSVLAQLTQYGRWDVVGVPELNVWNGEERVQFKADDLRPAQAALLAEELRSRVADWTLRYPTRDQLAKVYVALGRLAEQQGNLLPPLGELAEASAKAVGVRGDVLPVQLLASALAIFAELKCCLPLQQGKQQRWLWNPPEEGRLQLDDSPLYREAQARRQALHETELLLQRGDVHAAAARLGDADSHGMTRPVLY